MADALSGRSKRERKPSSRYSDFDQGTEAEAPTRSKAQPSLAKGSGSSQPVGGRSSTTRRTFVADSDDSSDSDCDSSESESEDSSEECEEDDTDVQPNKRRAASAGAARSVFGALDADERLALDQNRRNKKNEGTMKQYATVHGVWERWLKNGGYTGGPAVEVDLSVSTPDLRGTLVRFMNWYAAGRKGDPFQPAKAPVSLKGVHAALQELVKQACIAAGTELYHLRVQGDYSAIYDTHCTKSASRQDAEDSSTINLEFTRDDYVRACHHYLGSTDANANRDLSMMTYQTATVSRGDEVRPRRLCQMDTRVMDAIGPSKCVAWTFYQPGGKVQGGRPALMSFIRNRLPECCPVRALFAHLAHRWAVKGEPMPEPGTEEWSKLMLFPGRGSAQKQMSSSNHERIILAMFKRIDKVTRKVTHEFRVFPAQAMYEMGVSVDVIHRAGQWVVDPFTTAYIIPGFSPEGLMALAFWAGAAQKDFTGFWAERFIVAVPEELLLLLCPGLRQLETAAAAQRAAAGSSRAARAAPEAERVASALRMGLTALVQDSLELAEKFPDNSIHRLLLQDPIFRELLRVYKAFKIPGGFEPQRPLSDREIQLRILNSVQEMQQHQAQAGQVQSSSSSSSSSLTQLNWEAFRRMREEAQSCPDEGLWQPQEADQSGRRQLPPEVLRQLAESMKRAAAGHSTLSPQQQLRHQQQQQQQSRAAEPAGVAGGEEGTAGYAAAAAVPAGVAAVSGAAAAAAGITHPGQPTGADAVGQQQQQQQEEGDGMLPGSPRQQVPAFGSSGLLVTPSGQQHTAAEIAQRTVASMSPGGHYQAFFTMELGAKAIQQQQQQQRQVQQQQQQRQQQQRQQQHSGTAVQQQLLQQAKAEEQKLQQALRDVCSQRRTVSAQLGAAVAQLCSGAALIAEQRQGLEGQVLQLQQQQMQLEQMEEQHQEELTSVQQQKHELKEWLQSKLQQLPSGVSAAGLGNAAVPGQFQRQQQQQWRPAAGSAAAGLGDAELEAGQPFQSPLPPPAQQQQQQQYHWSAASILQQMGTGDPLGSIAQPYTAGLGMSLNTQQPFRGQEASVPIAGVASLFLELQSKLMEVKSTVDGLAAAGGSMRPGAQDASSDAAAVGPASAAPATGMPPGSWAAVGSRTVQAAAAGPGGGTAGPAAAPAGKGKKQQQKPLVRAFPSFGAMGSVKALAKYYFVDALPEKLTALDGVGAVNDDNLPWTPALADKAGLEKWRGGRQGLFQRWYEIRFVAAQVKEKVKQLSAAAGAGELATVTEAAAAMDAERTEMKLTLNGYYHFLKSGKGNSKGSSSGEDGGTAAVGSEENEGW